MTTPVTAYVVDRAQPADLDQIDALEQIAFPTTTWSTQSWRAELAAEDRDVLVARSDGAVVGVITVQTVDRMADLLRLAVDPDRRRQGIATALIDAGVAAARARGAQQMMLEVELTNDPAVAVYQRYGFEQLASRSDYYGPGRHALILKRWDLSGPLPVTVDWVPTPDPVRGDHD